MVVHVVSVGDDFALPSLIPVAGDLSGTAAAPTVAKVRGVSVSATAPTAGQILTASTGTAAAWATPAVPTATFGNGVEARRVDTFGADPTGVADSAVGIKAAWAALPSTGGVLDFSEGAYRCDIPVAYTDTDSVGTALLLLANKNDVLFRGKGSGARIYTTTATATELVRLQNTGRLQLENVQFRVTGTAKVVHGLHITCSTGTSVHEVRVSGVRVISTGAPTLCFDANGVTGTNQIVSATAAFGSTHVGGAIAYWQGSDAGFANITACATLTGTVVGALTAVATSVPLSAAISGAPSGRYVAMIDSEMVVVTSGGQSSTLTVTRGWGNTTAATHLAGAAITTYSATLDSTIVTDFSSAQEAITFQPAGTAVMQNAFSLGVDHPGAADMDIAGVNFIACNSTSALCAMFKIGNGTPANILDINAWGCNGSVSLYGVQHNSTMMGWHGHGPNSVGVAHKVCHANSQALVIIGSRIEHVGRLYDAYGLGTTGNPVVIKGYGCATHYAMDGVPIRHQWSAPLSLEDLAFSNPVNHPISTTFSIVGAGSQPTPVYVKNVGVPGAGDPFTFLDKNLIMLTEFAPYVFSTGVQRANRGARIGTHLSSFGPVPTIAAGAAAGTSPPAATIVSTSTDQRGQVSLGSGTAPTAGGGVLATVTYANPFASGVVPIVLLAAVNAATAPLALYVGVVSNTTFQICSAVQVGTSQAVGTYLVNYILLG